MVTEGRIIERLDKFIKTKGLTANQVSTVCRLSNGLLSKARTGKNDISLDTIEKIVRTFPDLSRDWLITGEGPMLREERGSVTGNTVSGNGNTLAGRVVYPEGREGGMSLGEEVIRLRAQNDLLREQNEKLISALTARGDRA